MTSRDGDCDGAVPSASFSAFCSSIRAASSSGRASAGIAACMVSDSGTVLSPGFASASRRSRKAFHAAVLLTCPVLTPVPAATASRVMAAGPSFACVVSQSRTRISASASGLFFGRLLPVLPPSPCTDGSRGKAGAGSRRRVTGFAGRGRRRLYRVEGTNQQINGRLELRLAPNGGARRRRRRTSSRACAYAIPPASPSPRLPIAPGGGGRRPSPPVPNLLFGPVASNRGNH